jgi:outer membrane protein assembly factor BamB
MNRTRLALATIALAAALVSAGCATKSTPEAPRADDASVGHIHGLGIDPADDTLYVATHHGLFHVDETGEPKRVADRWQDTMAFTVVGPGHFLGSGHPDLRDDLPPHLGLIESTDAGETWTPLALQGDADFHILEPAGDVLYAYDATTARLLRTEDRTNFEEILAAPLINVAARDGADRLTATTGEGKLISIEAATGETLELGGPTTIYLDSTSEGTLAGIDPDGVVRISANDGESWRKVGSIEAQPAACTISDQDWYAATDAAVFRSSDGGSTWSQVL